MVEFKVQHINTVTARGKVYYYDRITGKRIFAPFGTAEFLAEVEVLRSGTQKKKVTQASPGTLGALIQAYRSSPEFSDDLSDRSRKDYNRVMDYLSPLRNVAIASFDPAYALAIRDKANKTHKFRFANYTLAVLSVMFNYGIPRRLADTNPTTNLPKIKRPRGMRQQNRAWLDHELTAVLEHAPKELGVAVALGAYSGLREADVLKINLNSIQNDVIEWRVSKTDELLEIPVHRDLLDWIETARKLENRKGLTIVIGKRGRPFTESGFRARFFKMIRDLEAQKKIGHGLTFHGLRHTVGTRLADAGADDFTIQTILGHKTAAMAQNYRRDASKKRGAKAAIHLLETAPKKNK